MRRRVFLASLAAAGAGCVGQSAPGESTSTTPPPTATPEPTETDTVTTATPPTETPHPDVSEARLYEIEQYHEFDSGLALSIVDVLRVPSLQYRPELGSPPYETVGQLRELDAPEGKSYLFFTYRVENRAMRAVESIAPADLSVVYAGAEYEPLDELRNGVDLWNVATKDVFEPRTQAYSIGVDTYSFGRLLTVVPRAPLPRYAFKWDASNDGVDPVYWYVPESLVE